MSVPSSLSAAPAQPGSENFGQYLIDHTEELAPFFNKNLEELVRKAMPMVWGILGFIMLVTICLEWVADIGLARGFTPFFAPAYAKLKRAVIYSSVRMAISLIVLGLMAVTVYFSLNFLHAGIILLCVGVVLSLVVLVTQVGWLAYQFKMNIPTSVIFFVIIIGAEALIFIGVASWVLVGQPSALAFRFVNQTLAPQMQAEVSSTKDDLASIQKETDDIKAKIEAIKSRLNTDQADEEKLNTQIDNKKNSEMFLFQKIVKLEAMGDLAAAHDQFTAMLAKYPNGALADTVKSHLTQVDNEIATEEAQKKQAEADAAAAAAAARADLLARAGRGEVTLSEMRQVLVGKNRADVTALLGTPAETGSDKWGYGQQMIVNPMTKEKHGLAVYFNEGVVQSVDYYYGTPR
jgi:hypothetical protein